MSIVDTIKWDLNSVLKDVGGCRLFLVDDVLGDGFVPAVSLKELVLIRSKSCQLTGRVFPRLTLLIELDRCCPQTTRLLLT